MPNQPSSDIAIIGGGASGLAAAISAAQSSENSGSRSPKIIIAEKLDRIGKKLLATGNGRCNLGNAEISAGSYSSAAGGILAEMLSRAPASLTLGFFERLGLLCDVEESGRVYPYCRQASMVLDVLRYAAERLGIETLCGFDVVSLSKKDSGFVLTGKGGENFFAKAVVLAAGGCAAAQLGTEGGGFALAKSLGHSITPLEPCLVPLKCALDDKSLKGIRASCRVALTSNGRELHSDEGEVQFTEYGLSGIPAMQLSRFYSQKNTPNAKVVIDFLPQLSREEGALLLERRRSAGGNAVDMLLGTLNKRICALLLKRAEIDPASDVSDLSHEQLDALLTQLKGFTLRVTGTLAWSSAQVTRGGVPLGEIDPLSCESRLCRSLYLTGELLDAAGECGGYNLHWAWFTGMTAGKAAVRGLYGC